MIGNDKETKIICSKCGTKNELNSKFCQNCGHELESINNINENPKEKLKHWWDKKSKTNKSLTGIGGCCLGIILFIVLMCLIFPVTSISVDPTQVQIDNQTTEYTIHGTAEPNATVKITAPLLNLNDAIVNVDSNGSFSYTVSIPINVTEANINITAKSPKKSQNGVEVNIQRPLTSLTVDPVNLSSNATTLVIQGKTDPNAVITLNCGDLNLKDVQVTADGQGNFNKTITVPNNLNTAKIEIMAKSTGKRVNTQTIDVKRESAPAPASTPSVTTTPSTSSTQPTVATNPSTATSTPASSSAAYVGNSNTHKFHLASCRYVSKMNDANKVYFNTRDEAIAAGYTPCKVCSP
jgi:hypothetical protein